MDKVLLLLRVTLLREMGFSRRRQNTAKNEARQTALRAVGLVALLICLEGSMFMYTFELTRAFAAAGDGGLALPMMMFVVTILTLLSSFLRAGPLLFGFRDYDALASLPVSTRQLAASRIVILYLYDLLYAAALMVPAFVSYAIVVGASALQAVAFIITLLFFPALPMAVGGAGGSVVSALSARFKYKNIAGLVMSVLLMGTVMYFSYGMQSVINKISANGGAIIQGVYSAYPLARMYTSAVLGGSVASILLLCAISAAPAVLLCIIVASRLPRLRELYTSVRAKNDSNARAGARRSQFAALYRKEFGRFASSPTYMLNCGFGVLALIAATVASMVLDIDKLTAEIAAQRAMSDVGFLAADKVFLTLLPIAMSFCVMTIDTAACSISLEGKYLDTLRTMPVPFGRIIWAKLAVNLTLSLPAVLISAPILGLRLGGGLVYTAGLTLFEAALAVVFALIGMTLNLLLPKLDFSNEGTVIKQSGSVGFALLSGFIVVGAFSLLCFMLPDLTAALYICAGVTLALCAALALLLRFWGTRRLATL